MKEGLINIVVENLNVIVSTAVTLLLAWIKKKADLRKLKKSGRLIDVDKINYNGKFH